MSKYTQEELDNMFLFMETDEMKTKLSCPYCDNYTFPMVSLEMVEHFIKNKIGSHCSKCGNTREYNRQNVSYVPNPHFIKKDD